MANGGLLVAKRSVVKRFFAWLTKALGLRKQYAVIQISNPLSEDHSTVKNESVLHQTNIEKEPKQTSQVIDKEYERKLSALLEKYENGEVVISSLDTKILEDLSKRYETRLTYLKGELKARIG